MQYSEKVPKEAFSLYVLESSLGHLETIQQSRHYDKCLNQNLGPLSVAPLLKGSLTIAKIQRTINIVNEDLYGQVSQHSWWCLNMADMYGLLTPDLIAVLIKAGLHCALPSLHHKLHTGQVRTSDVSPAANKTFIT